MFAIVHDRYGPPSVLRPATVPKPRPGPGEVLVRVRATQVTAADWRMRGAHYPGGLWLPGRLMSGLLRPRHAILGTDFAGEIAELGAGATRFSPGQKVYGTSGHGAYAEFLAMPEGGCIGPIPAGLDVAEAAALPFGGVCALVFLRDFAELAQGQKVLVTGASGGVGVYAVQIARHLGAEVVGAASAGNLELVRTLGAARALDYRAEPLAPPGAGYDLIFDTVGALSYAQARAALRPTGLFLPLNFGLREALQALVRPLVGGPRLQVRVSGDSAADLATLTALVEEGAVRPVIDRSYPLERVAEAHAYVEARHRRGSVVLTLPEAEADTGT